MCLAAAAGSGLLNSLLGIGTAALGFAAANSMANMGSVGNASSTLNAVQSNNASLLESVPETPQSADSGENAEAEAARQQQLAAMEANQQMTNTTSGLGVTSQPNAKKKEALGA